MSNFPHSLEEIAANTRYPIEAFHFVRKGLDFTVHRMHQQPEMMDDIERHVSGLQLCEGLRDYALMQYGRLAKLVLTRWRITKTEDFGHIVFAMVDGGLMQATENDRIEDFYAVFDLASTLDAEVDLEHISPGWMSFASKEPEKNA